MNRIWLVLPVLLLAGCRGVPEQPPPVPKAPAPVAEAAPAAPEEEMTDEELDGILDELMAP